MLKWTWLTSPVFLFLFFFPRQWGSWSDISDRMVGHPQSVDAMCKVSEDVLVTGSSDGLLRYALTFARCKLGAHCHLAHLLAPRVVHVHPNKILGMLGEHEGFPVERIRMSGDGLFLGSCSHDKTIKFWSTAIIPKVQSLKKE